MEDHLSELAVNCRAPLTLAYLFGQRMLERRRGGIILMSSLSSSQGSALIANYGATKAYNRILAEGLWEELRMQGIDVLTCSAGALSTPNYIESLSDRPGRSTGMAMAVGQVVSETLAALGKRPVVIPGWGNRFANIVMQRLLPHQVAIRLMGRVLRGMYAQK